MSATVTRTDQRSGSVPGGAPSRVLPVLARKVFRLVLRRVVIEDKVPFRDTRDRSKAGVPSVSGVEHLQHDARAV